jgi:hypothetical protein
MFPRAINNKEKAMLATIKEYGFAYELKFDNSPYSGGYMANIPILKETWCMNSELSQKHKENIKNYLAGIDS